MTKSEIFKQIEAKALPLLERGEVPTREQAIARVCKEEVSLWRAYQAAEPDNMVKEEAPVVEEESGKRFIERVIMERANEIEKTGVPRGGAIAKAIAEKRALYDLRHHSRIANRPMSEIVPTPKPQPEVTKAAKPPAITPPTAIKKVVPPL
jgi:hypothetical protein